MLSITKLAAGLQCWHVARPTCWSSNGACLGAAAHVLDLRHRAPAASQWDARLTRPPLVWMCLRDNRKAWWM